MRDKTEDAFNTAFWLGLLFGAIGATTAFIVIDSFPRQPIRPVYETFLSEQVACKSDGGELYIKTIPTDYSGGYKWDGMECRTPAQPSKKIWDVKTK